MLLADSIGVDMSRIIGLVRVIKDKETILDANRLLGNAIGLADISNLFLIAGIA